MPTARIITRFPDRAASLRKTLTISGYRVQIVSPEQKVSGWADIEYDLDAMPEYAEGAVATPAPQPDQVSLQAEADARAAAAEKERERRLLEAEIKQRQAQAEARRREAAAQQWEKAARELRERQEREAERQAAIMAELQEKRRVELEAQRQARMEAQRQAALRNEAKQKAIEEERVAARAATIQRRQRMRSDLNRLRTVVATSIHEAARHARLTLDSSLQHGAAWWRSHEPAMRERATRLRSTARKLSTEAASSLAAHGASTRAYLIQSARDWRKLSPADRFTSTRDYAFRQAFPVAAAFAAVFMLGWALAAGNTERAQTHEPALLPASSAVAPLSPTPVATRPVPVALRASVAALPSAAKTTHRGSRRHARPSVEDPFADDEEVVIIHHGGNNERPTLRNQEGQKIISDLE